MAIQRTKWRPDICDCALVLERDTDNPGAPLTLGVDSVPCTPHANLSGQALLNAIQVESEFKTFFIRMVVKNIPGLGEEQAHTLQALTAVVRRLIATLKAGTPLDEINLFDGYTNRVWKDGAQLPVSFDADRKLVVNATGRSTAVIAALNTLADGPLFVGKVIING